MKFIVIFSIFLIKLVFGETTEKLVSSLQSTEATIKPSKNNTIGNLQEKLTNFTLYKDGKVCALFKLNGKINVEDQKESIGFESLEVDKASNCSEDYIYLILKSNSSPLPKIHFILKQKQNSYSLDDIYYNGIDNLTANYSKPLFNVTSNHTYLCSEHQTFYLTTSDQKHNVSVSFDYLFVNGFGPFNLNDIWPIVNCTVHKPFDLVPLAVGCALISLIIIVLVAYIIGRRRNRRMTYQTV